MARISLPRVQSTLALGDVAASTTAKGDALESAARYVFEKFPGLDLIDRKVRDYQGVREIDLFFRNDWKRTGLGFLNWFLIVECKNHASPVGFADILVFEALLKAKNCPNGILIAASGIAGGPGQDGHAAIEAALQQGRTIVVVTRNDLERTETTAVLADLLEARFTHLTAFGTYDGAF